MIQIWILTVLKIISVDNQIFSYVSPEYSSPMPNQQIITQTTNHVKQIMLGEGSRHDWWHVHRVWLNAKQICKTEKANLFIVELAALLHDIADWKFHDGDETKGAQVAQAWLEKFDLEQEAISHICHIITDLSYKGAGVSTPMHSIEGQIVQDADRLDAIGAIGIARTFAYGGSKQREIFNPNIKPVMHTSFEEYKKNEGTTINHFYEKLLLLKDRMNTETGKKIAEKRHAIMLQFLDNFYKEINGDEL